MPTTLIVLAHPNASSFNGSWARATGDAAEKMGDQVLWSDLYALKFDPTEASYHYGSAEMATSFDPLKAQEAAFEAGELPSEVVEEVEKLIRADRVIFHFPLWWFAPPAMLKGYFDRVFVHGCLHSVDRRFDTGRFRGKSALMCVTTGASQVESAFDGKEADVDMLLWPTAYTLRYLGFEVLHPVVVHGVHGYHDDRSERELRNRLNRVLDRHQNLLEDYDRLQRLKFNSDDDFDREGRLRKDKPSHSHFIRHEP